VDRVDVDSPGDPRVAEYRHLQDAGAAARRGLFVAEGRQAVVRLVASGRHRVRSVLVTPTAFDGIAPRLAADVPVLVAPPAVLRDVVGFGFHRGCLALGERGDPPTPDSLLACTPPVIVVLEAVADPENVGGVFRNARALGAGAVLLAPGCADPLYRKAIRVSVGAVFELPFAPLGDWPGDVARLHAAGYVVVALTPDPDAVDLAAFSPPPRVALVLGGERAGLAPATLAAADVRVRIAMAAGGDSLNVATAAAIVLHRLGRAGRA
jgi:tRNA G18 (ribose-2'-O)-methylase SpoU